MNIVIVKEETKSITIREEPKQKLIVSGVGVKGAGVPLGGLANQILAKKTSANYDTEWQNKDIVITEHSDLTGLNQDGHPQYHNDLRGDVRYYTKSEIDSELNPIKSDITDLQNNDIQIQSDLDIAESSIVSLDNSINSLSGNLASLQTELRNENLKFTRPSDFFSNYFLVSGASITTLLINDNLRAYPFFIGENINFSDFRVNVSTAGSVGSLVKIAIYNNTIVNSSYYPGSIVVNFPEFIGNITGTKTYTNNITLTKGWYWLTYHCNNTATEPTLRAVPLASCPNMGYNLSFGASVQENGYSLSRTYTSISDSIFPLGASKISNNAPPILLMQRALL